MGRHYHHGISKNRGITNPNSKLNAEKVLEIETMLDEGKLTLLEIGEKFEVSDSTISGIKLGRYWSRVTGRVYKSRNNN